jgi:hypothetical protein
MRWTNSRDGRQRVTFRAEHRLDAVNLADLLCYRALAYGWDLEDRYSAAFLEGEIRAELADHGMGQWPYWRDELPDDDRVSEVTAWALRQVARLQNTRTGDTR